MYGLFTNIWVVLGISVGKYTIHWASGIFMGIQQYDYTYIVDFCILYAFGYIFLKYICISIRNWRNLTNPSSWTETNIQQHVLPRNPTKTPLSASANDALIKINQHGIPKILHPLRPQKWKAPEKAIGKLIVKGTCLTDKHPTGSMYMV